MFYANFFWFNPANEWRKWECRSRIPLGILADEDGRKIRNDVVVGDDDAFWQKRIMIFFLTIKPDGWKSRPSSWFKYTKMVQKQKVFVFRREMPTTLVRSNLSWLGFCYGYKKWANCMLNWSKQSARRQTDRQRGKSHGVRTDTHRVVHGGCIRQITWMHHCVTSRQEKQSCTTERRFNSNLINKYDSMQRDRPANAFVCWTGDRRHAHGKLPQLL